MITFKLKNPDIDSVAAFSMKDAPFERIDPAKKKARSVLNSGDSLGAPSLHTRLYSCLI